MMTYVCVSYIIQAPEGLRLPSSIGDCAGIISAILLFVWFMVKVKKTKASERTESELI